jgi:hypothetical protein
MASIHISAYTDNPRVTGWSGHARSELPKRLRRALNASPRQIRLMTRQVLARQPVTMTGIAEDEVEGLRVILETLGSEIEIRLT